jgi:hypothetical protein
MKSAVVRIFFEAGVSRSSCRRARARTHRSPRRTVRSALEPHEARRYSRWRSASIVTLGLLMTGHAYGQEIQLSGPLGCAPAAIPHPQPSTFEWAPWVAGGMMLLPVRAVAGIGGEGTLALARVAGDLPLRGGPWGEVWTAFEDVAADGGLGLVLGSGHSKIGAFGARLGAGQRSYERARRTELVATVTWGAHFFPQRWDENLGDDGCEEPTPIGVGSVARFFGTYRADTDFRHAEWLFGVELTPTFFVPPTWRHFMGER